MIQLFHDSKNCFENYLKGNYLLRQTIVTEMLHIAQTDHSDFNLLNKLQCSYTCPSQPPPPPPRSPHNAPPPPPSSPHLLCVNTSHVYIQEPLTAVFFLAFFTFDL